MFLISFLHLSWWTSHSGQTHISGWRARTVTSISRRQLDKEQHFSTTRDHTNADHYMFSLVTYTSAAQNIRAVVSGQGQVHNHTSNFT